MTISATTQGVRPGVCLSSARPASPFDGQLIYETDTNRVAVYDSTAWVYKTPASTTGSVLQVVSTTKSDTFSHATNSFTDITGMSVSITPTSSTSKILVLFTLNASTSVSTYGSVKLIRGATDIFIGDAAGSRTRASQSLYDQFGVTLSGCHLDSPATTSATTYKIQSRANDNATAFYLNRTSTDTDSALYVRGASSITVMEIAG